MQGKELDNYISYFKRLVHLAGYDPNDCLCLKYFTDGLPMGLYQDILKLDHPRNYSKWKEAAIEWQGMWEHLHHRQERQHNAGKPHPGMFDPFSSIPIRTTLRRDPNAMDTSADRGRTQGQARSGQAEDEQQGDLWLFQPEEGDTRPPFAPREGYLRRQNELQRGKREVQCYNCQQFGHISRFCPQKQKSKAAPLARSSTVEASNNPEDQANAIL